MDLALCITLNRQPQLRGELPQCIHPAAALS
jgi:hypothetical protein